MPIEKKYVIVDIDGTISKVGDRLKYLKMTPPDWDSFYNDCFNDEPIEDIIKLVTILSEHYNIIYCTGRRDIVRIKTIEWLRLHLWVSRYGNTLLMRANGDTRHDTEVKPELLKTAGIELDQIAYIIEDRNSMVAKWRDMGLTVLQPTLGDF